MAVTPFLQNAAWLKSLADTMGESPRLQYPAEAMPKEPKKLGTAERVLDALFMLAQLRDRSRQRKSQREGVSVNVGPYGPMTVYPTVQPLGPVQPPPFTGRRLAQQERYDEEAGAMKRREAEFNAKAEAAWRAKAGDRMYDAFQQRFSPQKTRGAGSKASLVQILEYLKTQPWFQSRSKEEQQRYIDAFVLGPQKAAGMTPEQAVQHEYDKAEARERGKYAGRPDTTDQDTRAAIDDEVRKFIAYWMKPDPTTGDTRVGPDGEPMTATRASMLAEQYRAMLEQAAERGIAPGMMGGGTRQALEMALPDGGEWTAGSPEDPGSFAPEGMEAPAPAPVRPMSPERMAMTFKYLVRQGLPGEDIIQQMIEEYGPEAVDQMRRILADEPMPDPVQ